MTAYYNEFDPKAAAWLRELIKQGHIAAGDVDERSISDVKPSDLDGYTQCHFFAGIGVWSYALRRAGWSDDRPVWTGSCPCQPFSAAGKGDGFADERHLWPHWQWLIAQCRPGVIYGEQVASKDGLNWLDIVQSDLEGTGYASGAFDLCAAGFGAPHIRQRLFFVATEQQHRFGNGGSSGRAEHSNGGNAGGLEHASGDGRQQRWAEPSGRGADTRCVANRLADTDCPGPQRGDGEHADASGRQEATRHSGSCGDTYRLVSASRGQFQESIRRPERRDGTATTDAGTSRPWTSASHSHWSEADWLLCRDGKWRSVEPGTFPLADGSAARVGRLRGYGNAIVAQVAEGFIRATSQN